LKVTNGFQDLSPATKLPSSYPVCPSSRFALASDTWPGTFKKAFSSHIKHWAEADEWCRASLKHLKEVLEEAETESAHRAVERLTQSVKSGGVGGTGKIAPAVRTSLLRSDHATEQVLRGFTSKLPASDKKLLELGCKKQHLGALCRGLARGRNESECCVVQEAIAGKFVAFRWIDGSLNLADIISKHWGCQAIWPLLQALLFWEGDTVDLFDHQKRKQVEH
jgi:hypothetical protein